MEKYKFDINRPWLTLDKWQKDYVFDKEVGDNFLLTGRQVGKTTAMSLRAVELCLKHFKKGEFVLINSITEKQAYHMLAKSKVYAEVKYERMIDNSKENKPTKHRLNFKNGTGILCYAAGETGEGQRGLTIKKLMVDEGSRMSEEYFIAVMPMMSVIRGSMDISSTPFGKHHKDGSPKFFYKCSLNPKFKRLYISSEDCPRHTKEFLEEQKKRLTKLAYAQEYLAQFTDELKRLFNDEIIKKICTGEKQKPNINYKNYLGCDIAGLGEDECTYEIFSKTQNGKLIHSESIVENRNLTTDTSRKIINLNEHWKFKKIGIDDGGVGFGVWSELMGDEKTKRITDALNNASRETDRYGNKSKKLLKEEMYLLLQVLMETNQIILLNDDEVINSLSSIQHDEGRIFGSNSHIAEGIIRSVWMAEKDKSLNIYIR